MSQLVFDEDEARQVESVYRIREAQQRRRTVRETLRVRSPASACSTSAAAPASTARELAEEVGPSGSVVGVDRQRGDARAGGAGAARSSATSSCGVADATALGVADARLRRRLLRAGARVRPRHAGRARGAAPRAQAGRPRARVGHRLGDVRRCRATSSPGACSARGTSTSRTARCRGRWRPRCGRWGSRTCGRRRTRSPRSRSIPRPSAARSCRSSRRSSRGRAGVERRTRREAWLAAQRALDERGEYYFAVTQLCFTAREAPLSS